MRKPQKRVTAAIAIGLALAVAVPTMADQPRPIVPVAQSAFTPVPKPVRVPYTRAEDPLPTPTPTPKPTPKPKPKPKPKATPKPYKAPVVRGTIGVLAGSRLAKRYADSRLNATQFGCLLKLWNRESGWRWNALNRSSGAYGIPQALPGTKMAKAGSDWRTNPITQVKWGLGYISGRYGTACAALRHSNQTGWY